MVDWILILVALLVRPLKVPLNRSRSRTNGEEEEGEEELTESVGGHPFTAGVLQ